jgi:nucleotide-binding universal stress UspA family protein
MFNSVVWATDGSVHADRALAYARELAERDGATLHVAHVVEKIAAARMAGQDVHVDELDLEAKIATQRDELARAGLTVELHRSAALTGETARALSDIAAEVGADVIVTGTRGRSPVVGVVVGSVTQRLLHVAPCPIFAVPPRHLRGSDPAAPAATVASDAGRSEP